MILLGARVNQTQSLWLYLNSSSSEKTESILMEPDIKNVNRYSIAKERAGF